MNFSNVLPAAKLSGSADVTISNMKRGLSINAIDIVLVSKTESILGYTMIEVTSRSSDYLWQ